MGAETWLAIGKFISSVFGFASAGKGWYYFAVQVARLAVVSLAAKAFQPKLDLSQQAREKLLTVRDPIYPQRFIYGQDMVSGPMFLANTQGSENAELWTGVILVGHEIDSFISYRLDDVDIALGDLSGAFDGDVVSGKFANVASVYSELGTSTQAVRSEIDTAFGSLWGTNHTGQGWAYMMWKFTLVTDNTAFETGAPINMRAVVRGKKVYDPRLDVSPGASPDNPSFIAWSDNPALCLADFIRDDKFGMQELDSRLDWNLIVTAADICEETVSIPGGSQTRYTCNVTFAANENRGSVRDVLLTAMMGRMVFSQGLWKIWAGAAITPDVTLTESNLGGQIQVQASTGAKERYNRVRGKFIDPSRNYQAQTYPEQRSSVFETEDGDEVRSLVADFTAANNTFEAQRNAIITLKQSRNQRVVSFQGNMSCFRIQPGTTVLLTIDEYGFAGEKFFVTEWQMNENGILLTLIEEVDSAWNDPVSPGDYTTRNATGTLVFGNLIVPPPTNLIATGVFKGVRISWDNPPDTTFDVIEIWASDTNVRGDAVLIDTTKNEQFIEILDNIEKRRRFYWVRARSVDGKTSTYEPDLTTTTAIGQPLQERKNWVLDPEFDIGIPWTGNGNGQQNEFWRFNTFSTSTADFITGGGQNGSNAIDLDQKNDGGGFAELEAKQKHVWHGDEGSFLFQIKYQTIGTADSADHDNCIVYTCTTNTGFGSTSCHGSQKFTMPRTGVGVWKAFSVVHELNSTDFNFISFKFAINGNQGTADKLRIDSITVHALGAEFGSLPLVAGATMAGPVPKAQSSEQGLFLKGDGSWGTPTGSGVDSFEARTGTVVAQAADYADVLTSFTVKQTFRASVAGAASIRLLEGSNPSSPLDGDIWITTTDIFAQIDGVSESLLGGSAPVDSVFGRTGIVVALLADYDSFFLTPSEGNAAYEPLGVVDWEVTGAEDIHADRFANAPVQTVFGRSGTVVALQADYDSFFLTPSEGNAAYSLLGHAHTLSDISDSGALAALNTVDTAQIDNNAVTLAKLLDIATQSFLGRNTAATGDPEILSATTARAILNVEDGSTADQTSIVGITGTAAQFDAALTADNFAFAGGGFHDGFSDFVADEHIDWSVTGAEDIHTDRLPGVITDGSVTDAMLRWTGTIWVEETQIRASAGGVFRAYDSALSDYVELFTTNVQATLLATQNLQIKTTDTFISFDIGNDEVLSMQTNIVRVNTDSGGYFEIRDDIGNNVRLTTLSTALVWNFSTNVKTVRFNDGVSLTLEEKANAESDLATFGQFWVRNDDPNTPMFTDDDGNDYALNATAADDSITNAILAEMAANTVKANVTASTANPTDFAIPFNTVLGRQSSNIVAAQIVTAQIEALSVTNLKLENRLALSLMGRASNSVGTPADIQAGSDGQVLRRASSLLGFGSIATAGITDDAVTYPKMQNVAADDRILGNIAGAGSIIAELTGLQVNTMLPNFNSTLDGLAPLSGGGTDNFLRADGSWVAPSGGGNVSSSGSPSDDQIAIWTSGSQIEGVSDFTLSNILCELAIQDGFKISGSQCRFAMRHPSSPTDEKVVRFSIQSGFYVGTFTNDAETAGVQFLRVDRSGTTPTEFGIMGGANLVVFTTADSEGLRLSHSGTNADLAHDSNGELILRGILNGATSLYWNNVEALQTQDNDGADNITGARVKHWDGNFYDVGMARMPKVNFTSGFSVSDTHWHKRLVHNGSAGVSLNVTFNSETTQPQDVVLWVLAKNGPVVLVDGTMVLHLYDGASTPVGGDITIARGGWATVVKDTDTLAHVTGIGLTQ